MKKLLLTTLALILSLASAFSQSVPKHEFSFSASYALKNTFLCSIRPDQTASLNAAGKTDVTLASSLVPVSFEYTYHFDNHWGISTGISLSAFASSYWHSGQRQYCTEGTFAFPKADDDVPPPVINAPRRAANRAPKAGDPVQYGYEYSFDADYERNELVMEYAAIPVLAYYRSAFGNGKWNFYGQAGFKFGFSFAGQVNSITNSTVQVSSLNIAYKDGQAVFSKGEAESKQYSKNRALEHLVWNDDCNRFNIFASLEAGIRIPIWRSLGIYTGIYGDLGLLRAVKYSGKQQYSLGEEMETSIFGAREETPQITADKDSFTVTLRDKPLVRGVLPFSTGFRVRIAF